MTTNSVLDEIGAEVAALTDEEIAAAAAVIQARNDKARERTKNMSEEAKQKSKDREAKRRKRDQLILKMAKEKGLVPGHEAAQPTA